MKVTPLERDVYLVESQGTGSDGVEEYRVDLSEEDFGCACESYQFNYEYINHRFGLRDACKHILAAQRYVKNPLNNQY